MRVPLSPAQPGIETVRLELAARPGATNVYLDLREPFLPTDRSGGRFNRRAKAPVDRSIPRKVARTPRVPMLPVPAIDGTVGTNGALGCPCRST